MRCVLIMPHRWRGGMVTFALLLAELLSKSSIRGSPIAVTFAVPEGYSPLLGGLIPAGIELIEFTEEKIHKDDPRFRDVIEAVYSDAAPEYLSLPTCPQSPLAFALSDFWICLSGLFQRGPIVPFRPYFVYGADFIQRIVPDIFGPLLHEAHAPAETWWWRSRNQSLTMQNAESVVCTTDRTAEDAVSYAGVPRRKVHILPMINAPLLSEAPEISEVSEAAPKDDTAADYFLWVTNATAHKNQPRALEALDLYYKNNGRLKCYLSGPETHVLKTLPWFASIVEGNDWFGGKLNFLGDLPRPAYLAYLTKAAFLWHPVLYDNGTFSVIEAERLGTPSLVADYPQITFICETFGVSSRSFDPWSVADMAKSLADMERAVRSKSVTVSGGPPSVELPTLKDEFQRELVALIEAGLATHAA